MFGLGISEVVIILVVALLVLGPKKLPDVMRQLGKMMAELRRTTNEFQRNLEEVEPPPPPPRVVESKPTPGEGKAAEPDGAGRDTPK